MLLQAVGRLIVGSLQRGCLFGVALFLLLQAPLYPALGALPVNTFGLTLQEYRQRVVQRNESIQMRLLEFEANQRKLKAEQGIFEPELFGSYSHEANKRENTVLEQRSELGADIFDERNNIYMGGIEGLVPTGARIRLGYTLRDLRNNLQNEPSFFSRGATNGEFQTFFGASITQPLLKNAGFTATLAGVRIAAFGSDIAFQDYRRQMMLIISSAEAAYWNLYLAQEQVRFFQDSVKTAEKILEDTRSRLQAGRSAELEVLEAEAGMALRRSRLSEAEQKLYDAVNRAITFYSETVMSTNRLIRAAEQPKAAQPPPSMFEPWRAAFENNPDYLIQRGKVLAEYVRVGYARNQRLPELNLRGSYGLNGLGETPGASWDDIERQDFPSWAIGLELRVPLAGGIKSANELAAARLRRQEALVGLKEIETQLANGMDTAIQKMRSARANAQSYQTVIDFNQSLLNSALQRLEVGRVESRKVLDIEEDLFEARISQVEALVNCERAELELQMLEGSVLKRRDLERSQRELQARTAEFLRRGRLEGEGYDRFVQQVQREYETVKGLKSQAEDTPAQRQSREAVRDYLEDSANHPAVPGPAIK
jgi:outer membrane protein